MEIKIVKMGINGEGIGYINNKPTFVMSAFVDEIAEISIIEDHKTYQIARCDKIISPAVSRVKSVCNSKECHSCSLIEMDYKYQLIYKKQLVSEALYKYARIASRQVQDVVSNPSPLNYRNQLKLPVKTINKRLVSGMYQPDSNRFVLVEHCVVHQERLEAIRKEILAVLNNYQVKSYDTKTSKGLRHLFIRGFDQQYQCCLITGNDDLDNAMLDQLIKIKDLVSISQSVNTQRQGYDLFGSKVTNLRGSNYIEVYLDNYKYQLSPRSFFQLNKLQATNIYRYVSDFINAQDVVVDAYCGIGSMTMFVQAKAKKTIGIESSSDAINDAKTNARLNKAQNTKFILGDAAKQLIKITNTKKANVLIINPPRSGLSDEMIDSIIDSQINKMIYVSCNPSTLAKNLNKLQSVYEVESIKPFDMFSYTPLVETVVSLKRKVKR